MENTKSVSEIVREMESEFINGSTKISKYVNHSLYETLEKIDAYMNSVHTTGSKDALDRDKPFFDIVTAAVNVWYRATDIDRSHIKVRATKSHDWTKSFLATVLLQDWMRRERFGVFLNEWGRVLARYGSAVHKTVNNSTGLHISVVPWNRLICDSIDFDGNPKIEIIELTEGELRKRIQTHGYDSGAVEQLILAGEVSRKDKANQHKDNRSDYFKLYEIHGLLPLSHITNDKDDVDTFVHQMHVVSFVGDRKGRKIEYKDFTLVSGEEDKDPYKITHLIKEDGRTLAKGAPERLFEAQWMQNHTAKQIKDQLDLASKLIFQTADDHFVGRNIISGIETGDVFIHSPNAPLTKVDNTSHDITGLQNFANSWKQLGNEITGVSEAMLGISPKSGTAWRQTEAVLAESHSLFELMTENKALAIEDMLRDDVIPHLRKKLIHNTDEIGSILDSHAITQIDAAFVPVEAVKRYNERTKKSIDMLIRGETTDLPTPFDGEIEQKNVRNELSKLGNQRFFSPDNIGDIDWATALKDLEWELEVDVTGETKNTQEHLQTLNTALQVVMNPAYTQSKQAQSIVGKILEATGAMSPMEIMSMPIPQPMQSAPVSGSTDLPTITNQ